MWQPIEIQPSVAQDYVGFRELHAARANGLRLPALQRDAGFEALFDEVIMECLTVFYDAHVLIGIQIRCSSVRFAADRGIVAVGSGTARTLKWHGAGRKSMLVGYSAERMYRAGETMSNAIRNSCPGAAARRSKLRNGR